MGNKLHLPLEPAAVPIELRGVEPRRNIEREYHRGE